jgi:hypothetical protein
MTTWTCKGPIAALVLLILSACEGGQGAALFNSVSLPSVGGEVAKPLSQAKLAGGAFTLVAPRGFCIDSKSVQKQFAVMARCDVLGVPEVAVGAPLAFITVSVQTAGTDGGIPTVEHLAAASKLSDISDLQTEKGQLIFRATGTAPVEGVSQNHWRGTTRVGGQIVGVALYGPANGRGISSEGRHIVADIMSGSQSGS